MIDTNFKICYTCYRDKFSFIAVIFLKNFKHFFVTDGYKVGYHSGTKKGISRPSGQSYFLGDKTAFFDFLLEVSFMKKVAIIMGSDSDLPVVSKAVDVLKDYGVPFEVHVLSAHRTPEQAKTFSSLAADNGFGVIIAAAGKAAHLAGAIAANTVLPVIGIPIKASVLDGMDALLSTVQMPAGIPVATVAIDGAANAAILAVQILAVDDIELSNKLFEARQKAARSVLEKDREICEKFARLD